MCSFVAILFRVLGSWFVVLGLKKLSFHLSSLNPVPTLSFQLSPLNPKKFSVPPWFNFLE
jgi:hypothetical protein